MDVKLLAVGHRDGVLGWWRELIFDRLQMLRVLAVGVVHLVELPDHPGEVGLPADQLPRDDAGGLGKRRRAEVLASQDRLSLYQLSVEAAQRQPGREDGVLHVKEAVVQG